MRLLLILLLALSLPVVAQHQPRAGHMNMTENKDAPLTEGVIKSVDAKAGEIVIQHGQLDSIGMPPMTMAFGVAEKAWLGKLKVGDKVRFAAEIRSGSAIISRYEMVK